MKKTMFSLVFLTAAFAGLSLPAFAQVQPIVTANVPFPFTVENTQMPAGTYSFERIQAEPPVLLIRNAEGKGYRVILTEQDEVRGGVDQTSVVFDKIHGHYFLTRIWIVGRDFGFAIPESKAEREMAGMKTATKPLG